ncbi:MAG TPA: DUF2782 domain-containing protein [Usitatibacter sp.]
MRTLLAATLIAAALSAAAQTGERKLPAGATPLTEPPPPPPMQQADPAIEPVVTTRHEGDQEIIEYRIKGKLYMQRVTPKHGKPYVLMDHQGDGTFMRQDNPLDSGVRVPQWVLKEF